MSREIKPLYVGLFILVGTVLIIAFVFWIGFSRFFEEHKTYVTYFDESVKGLQKDATVNYRGVPVGRVGRVGIAPNGRLVEVILFLKPDFPVDNSLIIRLREQGITGLRFLEIDKAPEDTESLTPKIDFTPPYPLIRSYPSEITALKRAAERLYTKIISLDLDTLVREWQITATEVRKYLSKADVAETLTLLESNLRNLKTVTQDMALGVKAHSIKTILEKTDQTISSIGKLATSVNADQLNHTIILVEELITKLTTSIEDLDKNMNMITGNLCKVLSELKSTLRALRNEPGKIWIKPESSEPFQEEEPK